MKTNSLHKIGVVACGCMVALSTLTAFGEDKPAELPKAFVDGASGPGWRALGEADFDNINCKEDTWTWKDGVVYCTGNPTGVIAMKKPLKNFELVVEWCHRKSSGNSGIFVWASKASLDQLRAGKGNLPSGIEVQVLDLEYGGKKKANWYTRHGDVFPAFFGQ